MTGGIVNKRITIAWEDKRSVYFDLPEEECLRIKDTLLLGKPAYVQEIVTDGHWVGMELVKTNEHLEEYWLIPFGITYIKMV